MAVGDEVKQIWVLFKSDGAEAVKDDIKTIGAEAEALADEDYTLKFDADDRAALEKLAALRLALRSLKADSDATLADFQRMRSAFQDVGNSTDNAGVRLRALRGEYDSLSAAATRSSAAIQLAARQSSDALTKDNAFSQFMYNSLFRPDSAGNYSTSDASFLRGLLAASGEGSPRMFGMGGGGGGIGFWRSLLTSSDGGGGGGSGGSWLKYLASSGGWGALLGHGPAANQSATGGLGFLGTPMGVGAIAATAATVSPIIVSLLGGLVGGGAAFGAFRIASNANTNLTALQSTVTAAQQTLQQAQIQQQFSPSPANAYAVAQAQQALIQAQHAAGAFQRANAPALNLYNAGQGVVSTAGSVLSGALMRNATRTVSVQDGNRVGGTIAQQIPGSSFFAGLAPMLNQISHFITTQGPALAQMFRASLPYLEGWIKIFEGFASRVIPAVTSALQHFSRFMPDIVHLFNGISDVVAGVIRVFGWLAEKIGQLAQSFQVFVRGVKGGWDRFGHDMANWAQDVQDWISKVIAWFSQLPGKIVHFLSTLPGQLLMAGRLAVQGFINGIESMFGGVVAAAGRLVSSVGHTVLHILGIASPSRVMFGYGEMTGEGLRLGMLSKVPAISSAAHSLASAAVPGAGGYARAGQSGSQPVVVTLDFVGADQALATALKKIIRVRGGQPAVLGL